MRRKTGFTIIELLIVVIIIGVLATIAVPQFTKAVEKSKQSKAESMLALYSKAQAMHYAEMDTFTTDLDNLTDYVDGVTDDDGDWEYTVGSTDVNLDWNVVAARQAGRYGPAGDGCELIAQYDTATDEFNISINAGSCAKENY